MGAIKKPKFGGARKAFSKPPSAKANKEYGGATPKKAATTRGPGDMEPKMGNREFGFIQNTPKKATAAMSGRALPPIRDAQTSTRSDSRRQFKPKAGKKVF